MEPFKKEQERENNALLKAVNEGVKLLKVYALEIIKGQRAIRQDLRNLNNLRPLKEEKEEPEVKE